MKRRADGRYVMKRVINGKAVYFYSTEPTEAKRKRDFEAQLLNYSKRSERGKLFSEVAEEWEAAHEREVSYATSRRYAPLVDYAVEFFSGCGINDITPADVNAYLNTFVTSSDRGSKKTATMALSVLGMIFRYAIGRNYCTENPRLFVAAPSGMSKKQRKLPDDSDIKLIEAKMKEEISSGEIKIMTMFAYFLIYTGLRRNEALCLTWDDIDFENKVIHVTKSCYKDYSNHAMKIKTPKTEAGKRDVVLLDVLKKVLECYNKQHKGKYVFCKKEGELITDGQLEKMWVHFQADAGISFTPHQARHLFATILYESGIDEKLAQSIMGHASLQTTVNIYTHIRKKVTDDAFKKLNEYTSHGIS